MGTGIKGFKGIDYIDPSHNFSCAPEISEQLQIYFFQSNTE